MPANDASLVTRCRDGDRAAFREIVDRYQGMACAVAYSTLGDLAASEDAAQESFLIAWQSMASLREPDKLRSWLAGIVRNTARTAGRARTTAALGAEPESARPSPDEETARREEAALLWATIGRLPESYREPLVLYYREHQSVAEVAETMNLTPDAVKQRLSRGRELLRDALSERVEIALRRTGPPAAFTAGVLAALNASAGPAAAAGAGGGAVASPILSGAAGGLMGGILGSLIGVAGGAFGTFMSIRNTKSPAERAFMIKCSIWAWIIVTVWVGLYLYVAFCQHDLFQSIRFQVAYWTIHATTLALVIPWANRRAAELRNQPPEG